MLIELKGDALKLFEDFLKYGESCTEEVSDAMDYSFHGLKTRLRLLQQAYDQAKRGEKR